MPKGQITEDDLASGLKGLGGFGALGGPEKLRRDSPFRDSTVEPKAIEVAPLVEAPLVPPEPVVPPARPTPEQKRVVEQIRPKAVKEKLERAETLKPREKSSPRKADVYTERVTVQISPKMRDDVDALARDLQRAKTTTDERITANTVMRVAVQLLIEHFEFRHGGDIINSEEQLYEVVRQKMKLR